MRQQTRMVAALVGVALAVPVGARAGHPSVAYNGKTARAAHVHDGMSHAEHQRAELMKQGVYVPPPPPLPGVCAPCEAAKASGGVVMMEPGTMVVESEPAGRAVVGAEAPGYAAIGGGRTEMMASTGGEPMPVGVVRSSYAGAGQGAGSSGAIDPMHGQGRGMGSGTAMGQPDMFHGPKPQSGPMAGPAPWGGQATPRPRILGNLLGIPHPIRDMRQAREARVRDQHAQTTSGGTAGPIRELPASAVYGPQGHQNHR